MRAAWAALAALHLLPGVAALVAPAWFAAEVAGLPTGEPHYVRDVGVGEVLLAALALLALARPTLRRPVALVLGLQLMLHAASHAVDRLGGAVVPSLVLQATLLVAVLSGSRASAGGPPARTPPTARPATPR